MSGPDLAEEVRHLCEVGLSCSREQLLRTSLIAEAAERLLWDDARKLLQRHRYGTVLSCMQCDGWAADVEVREWYMKSGLAAGKRASMTKCMEFLLMHVYLRIRPAYGNASSDVFTQLAHKPVQLNRGKTSWNSFEACRKFMPELRSFGCQGVVIHFYCTDGLQISALKKMHRVDHSSSQHVGDEFDLDIVDAEAMQLSDWNLYMRCRSHACHSAVDWALRDHSGDGVAKDAHNAVRSVRANVADLRKNVDRFILQSVQYVHKDNDPEHVLAFWQAMKVSEVMLSLFVAVDPVFMGSQLQVSDRLRHDPQGMRKIRACMLHGLGIQDWSDTRWLKCCVSAACYTRSLVMGLDELVKLTLLDADCYHQWLRVHECSTTRVRRFFCIASVAPRVSERLHKLLMKDDRLLMWAPVYREEPHEELAVLAHLPDLVWQRMCLSMDDTAGWRELRHDSLMAAIKCASYLQQEVFEELDCLPFSLTQGDIRANLAAFKDQPQAEVEDETAKKIHKLLALGYDIDELARSVELIQHAACTVNTVEQGHGSGAALVKKHTYSAEVLCRRIQLHRLRACFTPNPIEKEMRLLHAKIDKLDAKRPGRVTGRHMKCRDMINRCMAQRESPIGACHAMQGPMRSHAAEYAGLSMGDKLHYDDLARLITETQPNVKLCKFVPKQRFHHLCFSE